MTDKLGPFELNKIYCMDCLEGLKQIPDNSIDLIVTDPPYGIDFQSARRIEKERFDKIEGDKNIDTKFISECFRILKEGSAIYVFTRWDVNNEWMKAVKDSGFEVKNCIVWDRVIHGMGDLNGCYAPCYDLIIFATKGKHLLKGKRPKDIIKVQRVNAEKLLHPTQKPISLIKQIIENSSLCGDIILDLYNGSGTTTSAAKQLNRKFIGFEISPEYCKIAEQRLAQEVLKL
jgi:DNA modification methylase